MTINSQNGQAVLEALIALMVLGSAGVAIVWLGQLQDIRQQLAHISRYGAFALAHQEMHDLLVQDRAQAAMTAKSHWWHNRQGDSRLNSRLSLNLEPRDVSQPANIGDPHPLAKKLRTEWQLDQDMAWVVHADIGTGVRPHAGNKLRDFDLLAVPLSQHTAIARGHGAATSDRAVQDILSGSHSGWRSMQQSSERAGLNVMNKANGVDTAWGRGRPLWDWLSSWQGQVPPRYLERRP